MAPGRDVPVPSPELLAVARRFFAAIEAQDGATLRNLVSGSALTSFVGTAGDELWTGERVRDGLGAHFAEAPDFTARELYSEAYECGPVGWAFFHREMQVTGRETPAQFRVTLVFAMEDGAWHIVHRHASLPTDNRQLHGGEHSALFALLQAAQDEDPLAGRSGLASIMFTDICGSSALTEVIGDRHWAELARAHLATIRGIVEAHDGTLVKSLGDGTLSVFSSARQALRAATRIQAAAAAHETEPVLRLRIGLHTGEIVDTGEDFFGTVVNKAARIAAAAGPEEILVSDATRTMVGGRDDLRFGPASEITLQGLSGRHLIHRLDWTAP